MDADGESLIETIALLRSEGFTADFAVEPDASVRCRACGHRHRAEEIAVVRIARFEGTSDPDDEAMAAAVVCNDCGTRGVLVLAYGPLAAPEEAAVAVALADGRHPSG